MKMYAYIDTEIKYSPKTLADFVFPTNEVEDTVMTYATGKRLEPLLLHGPSGTGKSKLAMLIPNAIENGKAEVYKIKAAEINNTEGLEKLKNQKMFSVSGAFGNDVMNYCVIEEYEKKLTTISSLKVLLDDYRNIDLTIFTSNHFNKIDSAILSRCKHVRVPPVPPVKFLLFASKILKAEKVQLCDDVLLKLLEETFNKHADNRKYYQVLSELINKVNSLKEVA